MTDKLIPRGFYGLEVADLNATTPASVALVQVTEIGHDGGQETEDRKYFDSIVPNLTIRKALTGNITMKGDIEEYLYPAYDGTVRTEPLFVLDHYYLIRFLCREFAADRTSKMLYCRWIGQYFEKSKINRQAGEIVIPEIPLKISIFGDVSYADNVPYIATSTSDETPTADYDPMFTAVVPDDTMTLAAAEAEISASLTNPWS